MDKTSEKERMNEMIEAAMKVARGDYSAQVELSGKNDEFDSLAMGLNMMIDDIRTSVEELQQEITERKRAQEELREAEERYRSLVNNVKLGIFRNTLETGGRFLEVNPAMEEITGYSRGELLQMKIIDLYAHPEEREVFIEKITSTAGRVTREVRFGKRDGTEIVVWATTVAVRDAAGKILCIDGIMEDITERKRIEEALRDSEAEYKELAESITDIFFAFDGDLRYTYWNKASEQLTGVSAKDALGKHLYDLFPDTEMTRRAEEAYLKALRTKQPQHFVNEYELGGEDFVFEISAYPSKDGLSVFVKDITERKRAEEALQEKTRELEAASQAKSAFLASMSHELRTPLNAVIGFSELMLDGVPGEINDEQKDCLNDILSSGQQLLNLINEVLDLSKVEAGRMELKLENLNLVDVIDEVVSTVTPMLDGNKHKLAVSVGDGLPQVHADKSRLRQILLNLLGNAIKFTPPGGQLGIKVTREDDWCQVSVVDNGIGIKKEDQEQIFEVFTHAETLPEEKKEGTGLGLALTKQFVEAIGGRIWVESEYGKGSKFTFTLPLAREGEPYLEREGGKSGW